MGSLQSEPSINSNKHINNNDHIENIQKIDSVGSIDTNKNLGVCKNVNIIRKPTQDDYSYLNNIGKYEIIYSYLNRNEKNGLLLLQREKEKFVKKDNSCIDKSCIDKHDVIEIFYEQLIKYNLDLELYNDKLYISLKFLDNIDMIVPYLKNEIYFEKKKGENIILLLAKKYEMSEALMKSIYIKDKIYKFFNSNKQIDEHFINNDFKTNYDLYKYIVLRNFFPFTNDFLIRVNSTNKEDLTEKLPTRVNEYRYGFIDNNYQINDQPCINVDETHQIDREKKFCQINKASSPEEQASYNDRRNDEIMNYGTRHNQSSRTFSLNLNIEKAYEKKRKHVCKDKVCKETKNDERVTIIRKRKIFQNDTSLRVCYSSLGIHEEEHKLLDMSESKLNKYSSQENSENGPKHKSNSANNLNNQHNGDGYVPCERRESTEKSVINEKFVQIRANTLRKGDSPYEILTTEGEIEMMQRNKKLEEKVDRKSMQRTIFEKEELLRMASEKTKRSKEERIFKRMDIFTNEKEFKKKLLEENKIREREEKRKVKEEKNKEREEKKKEKEEKKKERQERQKEKEEKKKERQERRKERQEKQKKREEKQKEREEKQKKREEKQKEREEKQKEKEKKKRQKEEVLKMLKEEKERLKEQKKKLTEEKKKLKEEETKLKEEEKKLKEQMLKNVREERKIIKELKYEYKKIKIEDHNISKEILKNNSRKVKEKQREMIISDSFSYSANKKILRKKKEIVLLNMRKNEKNVKNVRSIDNDNLSADGNYTIRENLHVQEEGKGSEDTLGGEDEKGDIQINRILGDDQNNLKNEGITSIFYQVKDNNRVMKGRGKNTKIDQICDQAEDVSITTKEQNIQDNETCSDTNNAVVGQANISKINRCYEIKRKNYYSCSLYTAGDLSKRRKKGNDIIGGVEMGETKIGRVNTERDSIGRGSSSRGPKWMDSGFRERRSGGIIHIPNNVMEEEVAESIILGKHENYEKDKKKRKEKKKISLFGQVKPVDLIRKGIDAYKILENEENLYVDVLIIGAGISGLAASYYLNKCNANFLVIEGRDRIGGRAFSTILPQRIINNKTLPETVVDLGANYLHCCDNADLLKEEVKKERDDNIFEELEKEYYTEDEDMLASELKVNVKEKKGVRKNKPKNKVVAVEAAARTGASTGAKKKKKKKHKNYDATSNEINNDNHLDQFDMNIMEGKLLNNIKLFKEEYIKLFSESNNPCFHDYINNDNMFKRCSTNLHSKIHCYTKDSTFSLHHFKNDEGGLYSEYDYVHTKNEKNRRKKKLKKSMLFMIRNNVDNICYLYKNYYKEKKKDIFNFLKSIDENIYLYNNLSDDTLLSSAPKTTINCTFKNENKKFKILSVNKDTRRRREYDKSLTQLAQKLKPKISLVCGKDNWESTFYAYWYNNENGKKIKSFKIYRINLLCDKIRVRAARKIRIFLFINESIYDNCRKEIENANDDNKASYSDNTTEVDQKILSLQNIDHDKTRLKTCNHNKIDINEVKNKLDELKENCENSTSDGRYEKETNTEHEPSESCFLSPANEPKLPSESYILFPSNDPKHLNESSKILNLGCNKDKNDNSNNSGSNGNSNEHTKKNNSINANGSSGNGSNANGSNANGSNANGSSGNGSNANGSNANDSNANGSDASESNTNACEAEGGNEKEFVANLDAQTYDLPEMKVGCEKNMNMSEKKKKNSKYYIAGSKNGNMKKKVSTIDLDILNYDKDLIIYDNYYNYGEEYYKIVQAGNVCESGKKKNITKTVLYDDMNKRRSLWDLLMECTEEIFNEMNINRKNFSMEEWKMLMVTLQSRYGYGSDLRETSIAMSRLPFSSYMDIDICPNYGSNNYISKNIKYYDKIKKNEQTPHIRSFKDDSSADQIVLDGWKWIIDYLSKDIQNKIFINTVAELVHVKDEGKKKGKEEFFSHSNTKNEQTCQEKRYPNNGNNTNKHSNNKTNMESYVVGSFSNYVKERDCNNASYESDNYDKNCSKGKELTGKDMGESSLNGRNIPPMGVVINDMKDTQSSHIPYEDASKLLKSSYKECYNKEDYSVLVKCKSYDTSKNINNNFHGTSDLSNFNYLNVNIYAKYVIVAVPLGCLRNNDEKKKNMHRKTQLEFQPKLHPLKVKALNNYKMGNHNKIILRFYPFNFIWPFDSLQLNCIDQKFQFLNLHAYGKVGCVLVHCFPPWSCTYGYIKKEYFIVNECLYTLNKMFERSGKRLPILVDYIITKWQDDHFSCGSYAYPYVNCNDNDLIYLRSPHPIDNPKVVFCGEYLSKSYFQCVDGAYDTGIRAAEDIAHIGLKLRSYDTKYYNTDVFFFPDNTCPFTNIPLPRINNSLIGFYITDGSDEALTDYESSSDDEEGCISNIPSSVVKEEYEFLSYSLGKILQFFNNLKGQDVCKNRKEDKERKKRKQKEQIMKNETEVLEKKESLNNIYHSYKDEARKNEPLINYQQKCTYSGTDNHKSSYSDSNLDGNDKKNSGISSSIPESLSRNHPIDMCNKPNSKDDFPVGDIQYEGAEDSHMNERRDILIYDNPGTSENLKDSNSPMESNERTNMTSYIASNTVLAAHATCSSHVGGNITSSLKGYPRKDVNVKESIFLNKYYNNLDVYIDKYMVKFNDIVFRNYNNIELNLLRKKEDAVITPIFIKSKFLMCRSLSAVLNKYYRFQFFIQKELFSKVQEVKDELLHYFNFSNCKYRDILFCHEEKINDDIISDEKKEKNVVDATCDGIFYEQARISSIIKEVDGTNHGTNMKGNIQFCSDETHYVKRSNINDSVANDNIEKNSINGGFVEKDVIISNNKVNTSCLNSECKNDEYSCKNYEHDIINNVKTTKRNEECVNSIEINQKESVHKQLDIDKKKKKNLYIHNRRICQLNGYLKYVLNHILITKRFIEENIRNINNYNKIKLNSTDFVFFFCYLLQYIMKVINYDLYHNCIDYNIIIQLLCDYVYYLIFYKHDALCYKCMNGGELIICDFLNCANGWHSYCLSSNTDESENKLGSLWFCPECVSTNVSHVYKVICQNQK
ncbi:lysine-specific histone demethylase 1, putative (LSD1) [Plasmodium malariae]|uniref:Lysine-specific histone demethylase 1, putative (LSD1) n=1 Tax=Plasmodium malariae TaxID=5858 RepID=A0A1A8W902_PLAMA|nr:lysine-specific histone demethylase 1, putative (LSD1) [Plasmodium malariae]